MREINGKMNTLINISRCRKVGNKNVQSTVSGYNVDLIDKNNSDPPPIIAVVITSDKELINCQNKNYLCF